MATTPILYYLFILVLSEICYGGDVIEREKDRLEKNLKVLRKDFNSLIENVEDFAGDFLKQIHEAGRLVGTGVYTNDEDYNWQDDRNMNAIKMKNLKKDAPAVTSTEPTKADRHAHYFTLSNEIPTRRKRAVQQAPATRSFGNRPPAPMNFIETGPRQTAPTRENVEQNIITPAMEQQAPLRDEKVTVVGAQQQNIGFDQLEAKANSKANQQTCATKTEKEIEMEKQKMEELKREVKKLNELVALLKDQQKLIEVINEEGGEYNDVDGDLGKDLTENSFLYKTLKQLANKRKKNEENNSGVSESPIREIDQLKLDLEKTAKTLDETKQLLMREKEKEELLESQLKRHNSELKFLKTMLENLYDKTTSSMTTPKTKSLRDIDFEDEDVSSLLGAVHTPKPLPGSQSNSVGPTGLKNNVNSSDLTNGFLNRGMRRRPLLDRQFFSNPMHTENAIGQRINNLETHNEETSRASENSQMNDLDLRLKLINLLANKEKNEQDMKAKMISEALAKLVQPEKKSDDDVMLDALKVLVKDMQEPKKNTEDDLSKLIKKLNNGNVQSKTDDSVIELELRQLQKAINNLKPKEDITFDNLDLLNNNKKGKDESQDFQTMLNHIISKNEASSTSKPTALTNDVTTAAVNLDKRSLAATQQLLNQYLAAANAPKGNISPMANFQDLIKSYSVPYSSSLYSSPKLYGGITYNQPNYQPYSPYGFSLFSSTPYSNLDPVNGDYGVAYPSSNIFVPYPTNYEAPAYNPLYSTSYPKYRHQSNSYPNGGYSGINQIPNLSFASSASNGYYPIQDNVPDVPNQLFQSVATAAEGNYQGHSYGSSSYAGASLDKPYGISQESDQYKSSAITDLMEQVQTLEKVITNLNKGGDYTQTSNEKATIAGVINSLSQPASSYAQPVYGANAPPYGLTQPTSLNQPAPAAPYGNRLQLNDGAQQSQYPVSRSPPYSGPPNSPSYNNQDSTAPYQPSASTYQPKESMKQRRQVSFAGLDASEKENYRRRDKRQISGAPIDDSGLGNAALSKVANVFKSYLEQNLNQDPTTATSSERHALDGLDLKLNALKTQLESRKSSPRSLHDPFGLSGPYQNNYLPSTYGGNVEYDGSGGFQIDKVKSKDVITIVLEKIIDSLFKVLPKVLTTLFGKLVIGIGDSYGDYYSPLQNVVRNLGFVGYVPLILIKFLESLGVILKYLKKSQFFKQFLLPGSVLALVAGSILFLIYFYQQDEPYGYIGYQAGGSDYPRYEPNRYGNPYNTITNNNNNNNYGSIKEKLPLPNYYRQSNILNSPVEVNKFTDPYVNGNGNYYNGNAPLPYSRGYSDYFKGNSLNR